jgi:hypothetical protein
LSLNTDNTEDIFALFISSIITKNTIVLNLIYNIVKSLFKGGKNNNSYYKYYLNLYVSNIDIPYWALYDTIRTNLSSKYNDRIEFLSYNETIHISFDLSFIESMKEYILIKSISNRTRKFSE